MTRLGGTLSRRQVLGLGAGAALALAARPLLTLAIDPPAEPPGTADVILELAEGGAYTFRGLPLLEPAAPDHWRLPDCWLEAEKRMTVEVIRAIVRFRRWPVSSVTFPWHGPCRIEPGHRLTLTNLGIRLVS